MRPFLWHVLHCSEASLCEDDHQSVIEYMQDLTGRRLDSDVIEMILSESNWKGNHCFVHFLLLLLVIILKYQYNFSHYFTQYGAMCDIQDILIECVMN